MWRSHGDNDDNDDDDDDDARTGNIPMTSWWAQRPSLNVSRDWTLHLTSSALLTSPRHVELSANLTRT